MNDHLSCIIVDDEPLAVRLLESFVAKTPGLELLASFTDSVEAINAVKGLTWTSNTVYDQTGFLFKLLDYWCN